RRATALNPHQIAAYDQAAAWLINLNRGGEARSVLQQGLANGPDLPNFHWRMFLIAAAENNEREMQQELAWSEKSATGYWVLWGLGHLQFSRGQPARADETFRRGVAVAGKRAV